MRVMVLFACYHTPTGLFSSTSVGSLGSLMSEGDSEDEFILSRKKLDGPISGCYISLAGVVSRALGVQHDTFATRFVASPYHDRNRLWLRYRIVPCFCD